MQSSSDLPAECSYGGPSMSDGTPDFSGIVLIPEPTGNMLSERQQMDYIDYREKFLSKLS